MPVFQVREKKTNKVVNVYAVTNNKDNFPLFLIYDKRAWKWMSAKFYLPIKTMM